jgi:uncharacterized protein (DUF2336 family)
LRERITPRVAHALIDRDERAVTLKLVARPDVANPPAVLSALALGQGIGDAELRGLLLERDDLPASARLFLVEAVVEHLRRARIVKGAVAAPRLERVLRDAMDSALTVIGETEAQADATPFAAELVESEKLSARVMLHAVVNGHVLFFADCLSTLASTPRDKVFSLLESGSRPALNALLARCGLSDGVRNLIARLIFHARAADLADDITARHFVVTALTEELIVEHDGVIPPELEDAFAYLSEQNVTLARRAARGVMSAFAGDVAGDRVMPALLPDEQRLALPAA